MPVALEGRDIVAMARTGSGKTACFLLPMFEKLKEHSSSGARALILSPTRELALQVRNQLLRNSSSFADSLSNHKHLFVDAEIHQGNWTLFFVTSYTYIRRRSYGITILHDTR